MDLQYDKFNIAIRRKRKWRYITYQVALGETISYTKPCLIEFIPLPQKTNFGSGPSKQRKKIITISSSRITLSFR